MHILFFQWFAFMQKGIENALKKMNVSYDVFYYDMKDWDNDEVLVKKLTDYLNNSSTGYDCIFSVNFIPMISDVCDRLRHEKSGIEESGLNEVDGMKKCEDGTGNVSALSEKDVSKCMEGSKDGTVSVASLSEKDVSKCIESGKNSAKWKKQLKYISWVYDCPVNIRRTDTLKNECNTIYFFDRIQAEGYKKQGVIGARHMPLAVDTDVFEETIRMYNDGNISGDGLGKKLSGSSYDCDVALVGKLYKSDYQYISRYQDDYTRGYLEGIVATQEKLYGGYVIDDCVNASIIQRINENFAKASGGKYSVIKPEVTYAMATEVTGRERYKILALLQNRCRVNLYSTEGDGRLKGINHCGPVDYYKQMPSAFHNAKINLNISLKVIQSGIPLRVFDVLGCGGFLITNYQHEIAECFENGRELVIYEDIPDLIAKVNYYLTHENERLRIARNGYEKVKSEYTFEKRMKSILSDIL